MYYIKKRRDFIMKESNELTLKVIGSLEDFKKNLEKF